MKSLKSLIVAIMVSISLYLLHKFVGLTSVIITTLVLINMWQLSVYMKALNSNIVKVHKNLVEHQKDLSKAIKELNSRIERLRKDL